MCVCMRVCVCVCVCDLPVMLAYVIGLTAMSPVMEEGPLLVIPESEMWCYCGVQVLEWCSSGVTVVFKWCYSGVTKCFSRVPVPARIT
jgi:hypothetical protein